MQTAGLAADLLGVETSRSHQDEVGAGFGNGPFAEHDGAAGVYDGGKPVCDNKCRASPQETVDRPLHPRRTPGLR